MLLWMWSRGVMSLQKVGGGDEGEERSCCLPYHALVPCLFHTLHAVGVVRRLVAAVSTSKLVLHLYSQVFHVITTGRLYKEKAT